MEYRAVGASGLVVSAVAVGTTNFGRSLDDAAAAVVVNRAIDLGVTLFDSAELYNAGRSEEALGKALGARRHDVVIATKWGQQGPNDRTPYRGGSRAEMMAAVERSLRRLKTDYIDLYQLHQPDHVTPIEETLRGLDDLIRQGKVRYGGVSNLSPWRVVEAQLTARNLGLKPLVSCQDEYSLLVRGSVEPDLMAAMQAYGVGLFPYTPLASGMLTGKYKRGEAFPPGSRFASASPEATRFISDRSRFTTEGAWDIVEGLTAFATERGHTILELAFSWLLGRPTVASIMAGATSPEQVQQNADAIAWKLTPEEMAEVDRICAPKE
jgi:aryl-alcohol dehydrogenase-like predicted oxidoreductase